MKLAVMKKWVAALESGRYKQTKGTLRQQNKDGKSYGHCCLGVLCDIYAKETGKGNWEKCHETSLDRDFKVSDGSRSSTDLPNEVKEWAGMLSQGGRLDTPLKLEDAGEINSLIELNDDVGYSFRKIAKVIKTKYRQL